MELAQRAARLAVRPLVMYWDYLKPAIGPVEGTPEEEWKWRRFKERCHLRRWPSNFTNAVRMYKLTWTDPPKVIRELNEFRDQEAEALFKWQMEYYEKQGLDEESLKDLADRLRPVSRLTNEDVDKGLEVADKGTDIAKSALTVLKDALLALSDGFREGREAELARIARGEDVFPELKRFSSEEISKRAQDGGLRKTVERLLRDRAARRRENEPVIQEVIDRAAARKAAREAAATDSKATAPEPQAADGKGEPSFFASLAAAIRGEKVVASLVLRDENGRRVDRRRDAGKSGARFLKPPPAAPAETVGDGAAAAVEVTAAPASAAASAAAAAGSAPAAPAAGAESERKVDPGYLEQLRIQMDGSDEQAAAVKRHMKKRRHRNARRAHATAPSESERLEWAAAHEGAAARALLQAPAEDQGHEPSLSAAALARKAHSILSESMREMKLKRTRPGPLLDELERAKLAVVGKPKMRIRKRNNRAPPESPDQPASSGGL